MYGPLCDIPDSNRIDQLPDGCASETTHCWQSEANQFSGMSKTSRHTEAFPESNGINLNNLYDIFLKYAF